MAGAVDKRELELVEGQAGEMLRKIHLAMGLSQTQYGAFVDDCSLC